MTKPADDALSIFRAALAAVDAQRLVEHHLEAQLSAGAGPLAPRGRIRILGAGKAAAAMARGAERVLGARLDGGVVVVKDGHGLPLERVEVLTAGHPVPDARSLAAGQRLWQEAVALGPDDWIVGLWSGGGSALIERPREGITLASLRDEVEALARTGAPIAALNALRQARSSIKGGQLAEASRARWINLVLSDVAGDDPAVVASGPAIRPGDGTLVIGRLADAIEGARAEAEARGYTATVVDPELEGEARAVGQRLAQALWDLEVEAPGTPQALLLAGEPTVTLTAQAGRGGRMQEAALAAALALDSHPGAVILCAGTDGTDGPTDAAGAVVDGTTAAHLETRDLDGADHLHRHDAGTALDVIGALLHTGPTRTNVRDLMVGLWIPPSAR